MEQPLAQLVDKLRKAMGDDLVSVILYGSSAASDVTGVQYDEKFSDINVLCVLREIGPPQLEKVNPVFRWWSMHRQPAPLLLSEHEVITSADCFAIEFHDMQQRRKVLFGRDVIDGLCVDNRYYRGQIEYELRIRLIRLRQKAATLLSDRKLLSRLLLDSVSTFCVLLRHALVLSGAELTGDRRAMLSIAQERFGLDPTPFLRLLDVREKGSDAKNAGTLLAGYLAQIGRVIDVVDRLSDPVETPPSEASVRGEP